MSRPDTRNAIRPWFKWMYYGGLTLLWLSFIPLGIEFYFQAAYVYKMHTNPFVREVKLDEGITRPELTKHFDATPHQERIAQEWAKRHDIESVQRLSPEDGKLLDKLQAIPFSDAGEREWYQLFLTLDEDQRQFATCVRGHMVAAVDEQGRLKRLYGSQDIRDVSLTWANSTEHSIFFLIDDWHEWLDNVRMALPKSRASGEPVTLPVYDFLWPVSSSTVVLADPTGRDAGFVFQAPSPPAGGFPENTRWLIESYRLKPNIDMATGGDPHYRTNSLGYRDDEMALPKPPGLFRILCVGSSTTEEGSTGVHSYPNVLEHLLGQMFPQQRFEVVNCGIPGATTGIQVQSIHDYLTYDADLVVIYEGVNDVAGVAFLRWMLIDDSFAKKMMFLSKTIRNLASRSLLPSDEFIKYTMEQDMWNLKFLRDVLEYRGIPVAMCSITVPNMQRLTPQEHFFLDWDLYSTWWTKGYVFNNYHYAMGIYNECLRELVQREKIPYIPVEENIDGTLDIFRDMCHLHDSGAELKAEIIAAYLRPQIAAMLEAKATATGS